MAIYSSDASGTEVEEARAFDSLQINTLLATASTGIPLGTTVSDLKARFESNSDASSALCRTMNQAFRFMANAVEPDLVNCYMQKAFGNRAEFYNGEFHIYDFSIVEEEGGEQETFNIRTKVRVELDDEDQIKTFEAFICESEESDQQMKFIQYLKKTIESENVAIYAKNSTVFDNNGDDQQIFIKTEVNSRLNDDGEMVGLKEISHAETSDDNLHIEQSTITQSGQNIRYVGWSGSGDRLRKFSSYTELIDSNVDGEDYAPTKLAYGDGAAIVEISGSTTTEGWDGDSLSIDANASRLAKVQGKESELPSDTTPADLSWSDSEIYDCSGEAEATIELDLETTNSCNERYMLDQETSTLCERWGY